MRIHIQELTVGGVTSKNVLLEVDSAGTITSATTGVTTQHTADLTLGVALAGAGNGHSHAFHRGLRGQTHDDGGDFWAWRKAMYSLAGRLTPSVYQQLAEAVFAEMLTAGWTAVGEFHYVHHRIDGKPYEDPNAMGAALITAARNVGIRLTLLDTCYLSSAPGVDLLPEQRRFGDGSVSAWLRRWEQLASLTGGGVSIGAAVHSIRAVAPTTIETIVAELPETVPLHIHLSEQPAENEQSVAAYGASPTQLLADAGALTSRTSVVHATHLNASDISLLGRAGVTAVFCPSTEADLGDGIGPARELVNAGTALALGSDQNAVIDPFLETRALEGGERLRSGQRGRFTPTELDTARTAGGYRALGLQPPGVVGGAADLIELDACSPRTAGSEPAQRLLAATAADVQRVVVGGHVVAKSGSLLEGRHPASLLEQALETLR